MRLRLPLGRRWRLARHGRRPSLAPEPERVQERVPERGRALATEERAPQPQWTPRHRAVPARQRSSLPRPGDGAGGAGAATAVGAVSGAGAARAAIRTRPASQEARPADAAAEPGAPPPVRQQVAAQAGNARPWLAAQPRHTAAGQRDCGCLEQILVREWAKTEQPSPQAVTAIDRLAALPLLIKEKLAAGLEAIHVGNGGVPDLDQMDRLKGVPLPSGKASWDACAGAYGERKIVVGSRPSPTPDVMCHEVGHALDDIDGWAQGWQSDSPQFRSLYDRCLPHMAADFHRHDGPLGRREFFADAFAAIASSQRPALVEMLSGDTRSALDVMLYFNVRYGM